MLHGKFEFHSNQDTLTYFTAKNRSKSFICINGLKNHIEASDLVHTLILWASWSLLIFVMVGQFLALWWTKHLKGGVTRAPSQRKVLPDSFCKCFEISVWNLAYNFSGGCHTSSSSFIPIWTLWPTLQPKKGQSFICIHGLKNYIEASDLVHTLKWCVSWPLLNFVMLGQFLALWWTKILERGS